MSCSILAANGGRKQHARQASIGRPSATSNSSSTSSTKQQVVAVLGGQDFLYSQMSGVTEELFRGQQLGIDADIATGDMRQSDLRSLAHLPDGFVPPDRFLQRVALHMAKNFLARDGSIPSVHVPLVMGIWGHKGTGKSFNLELCCKVMGMQPIIMSAGELEDEWAGEPGKRLRERYLFAARYTASSGIATCLIINDFDVGVGRFANTGNTVNTQILQGTLMALCDDPTIVSVGQEWLATKTMPRVPIFITANDLSCLYAPLVREGRMDKFFYSPTREESIGLLVRLFEPHLDAAHADALLSAFPGQQFDFFAASKSRLSDDAVRAWIRKTGIEAMEVALMGDKREYVDDPHGAWTLRQRVSVQIASFMAVEQSFESILEAAKKLAAEQQLVMDVNLVKDYMPGVSEDASGNSIQDGKARSKRDIGWRRMDKSSPRPPPPPQPQPSVMSDELRSYWEHLESNSIVSSSSREEQAIESPTDEINKAIAREAAAAEASAAVASMSRGWKVVTPYEVHEALRLKAASVLDVRSIREWDWGKIKDATHCPMVLATGTSMNPGTSSNPDFVRLVTSKFPDKSFPLILYGGEKSGEANGASTAASPKPEPAKGFFVSKALSLAGGEDFVALAVKALLEAGYENVAELDGGFNAWDIAYRPDGRQREKGKWADKSSGELEWWTASN